MPTTDGPCRQALRTDAERNRTAIVEATREVFAESGLGVPLTDVARRAGVGIATLYRRFPTREALIAGAFGDKMTEYVDTVTAALTDPDPWHGFSRYVEKVCAMQYEDRGFAQVLTMTLPSEEEFEAKRAAAYQRFEELIVRAKQAGRLNPDFRSQDLVMLIMANAGIVLSAGDAAPAASQRLVSIVLAAFDTQSLHPLAEAPGAEQMARAMREATCPGTQQSGRGVPTS